MNNIHIQDYFFKNFIAKLLGIIAAKEFPNCYEGFIKVILENLSNSSDANLIDTYLRILTCILSECDDRAAVITGEMLPVIMNVFKCSKENQKNREKCLKIIVQLINKLSYADGTDPELIARNLDKDDLIEQCLSLFSTIIISNPKLLFDIKKYTIRVSNKFHIFEKINFHFNFIPFLDFRYPRKRHAYVLFQILHTIN
jgi:hypothetical protein